MWNIRGRKTRWEPPFFQKIRCLFGKVADAFGRVLGGHRIRYYGFLTCQTRDRNIERIRGLLAAPLIPVDAIKAATATPSTSAQLEEPKAPEHPCPCCGSNMRIIETFLPGQQPKHKPAPIPPKMRIDTS
jgi:hypothetical protein